MLDALAPLVLPGGALTYAVCTFDSQECESVIEGFLASHPDFHIESPLATPAPSDAGGHNSAIPWDILTDGKGFVRTWPHRHDSDAFFAVRLRAATSPVR